MKYNNTNILPKATALIFTLQFGTLKPLEMPACLIQFTGNGINYIQNCKKIDEYVQKNKNLMSNSLEEQFTAIETELFESEQKALLAIKEKYQISNEIWQKYEADLHRMKTIYTKHLTKKNPTIVHDQNIPINILETLITLLQHNGINPHSIHITLANQETIDKNPNTIAQAINGISVFTSDKSEHNFISYKHQPAKIEIFPAMLTETSAVNIMSTCAHEIQHVIQHHNLITAILGAYLIHYYNVDLQEFKQSPEFHTLAKIHEAQAEILSALKNPKIAECLKIKRETVYYPDHLYEEHFYHLAYIDMLWKTHRLLNNLNNCSSINSFKC